MAVEGHPRSLNSIPIESVYNFLLVINSNLGPVLLSFRDIAGFLLKQPLLHTTSLFHLKFRDVPLAVNRRCWGMQRAKTLG